ncbi:MAG: hypothetical protein M3374_01445 [Pseudomonadota bacterium]|nr:hypothetical protein [Pseudomonadota bacterium]
MDSISIDELALLDVLHRIDQGQEPGPHSGKLRERLIESGLVEEDAAHLRLTEAGIERCKGLYHRVAADAEAALILKEREKAGRVVSATV